MLGVQRVGIVTKGSTSCLLASMNSHHWLLSYRLSQWLGYGVYSLGAMRKMEDEIRCGGCGTGQQSMCFAFVVLTKLVQVGWPGSCVRELGSGLRRGFGIAYMDALDSRYPSMLWPGGALLRGGHL